MVIFLITTGIFGSLFTIAFLQSRTFNLVRIKFSDSPTITENTTIVFVLAGQDIDFDTFSSGIVFGGEVNEQGIADSHEAFLRIYNQKLYIPIEFTTIQLAILWLNISVPSGAQTAYSKIIDLGKSQTLQITSLNAIAGTIGINVIPTLFWLETWF